MSKELYGQCLLCRNGDTYRTAWIPKRFAIPGKTLRIKLEDGEEQDGWVVCHVGRTQTLGIVRVLEDQHRRHRKTVDV